MSITIGTQLGSHEIIALLGKGGMGEVYRGRDTRLKRDVAIKVLPQEFSQDEERLLRFQREAEVLASLTHPGIAAIYDLAEHQGSRFLVLELVEGETLAERIARGPVPLDEALAMTTQIAEALEAAHEKGIIHRDLKPPNIKVTPQGTIKVLDFGLAKIFESKAYAVNASNSPTIMNQSGDGVILGTASYMSPEQSRAKNVDKKTDIWGLGCVLFELLTGAQAFPGEHLSDTFASIIKGEPEWSRLPQQTPTGVRRLLQRCLHKDARQRFHDAADIRIAIEDIRNEQAIPAENVKQKGMPWWLLPAGLITGALISAGLLWPRLRSDRSTASVVRLALPLPANVVGAPEALAQPTFAISPDGSVIVYTVKEQDGKNRLVLRTLDRNDTTTIAGTDDATTPFFSPDSKWLGFFTTTTRQLKKVALSGGAPIVICGFPGIGFGGASWGTDGTIIVKPSYMSRLWKVSSSGGTPQPLSPQVKGEVSPQSWPNVLPDGRGILFEQGNGSLATSDDAEIALLEPGATEPRILIHGGTSPRYVSTGHLLYAREGALLAVPFDLKSLQPRGTPVIVQQGIPTDPLSGGAFYSVSQNGTLVFEPGAALKGNKTLAMLDRKGNEEALSPSPNWYSMIAISPSGLQVVTRIAGYNDDIWVYDTKGGQPLRLSNEPGDEIYPTWTHDGMRIAYGLRLNDTVKVMWRRADGNGGPEPLSTEERVRYPHSLSPDDQTLAVVESSPSGQSDILLMSMDGAHQLRPFATTKADESAPSFSPVGSWLVYVSDETGKREVYVRALNNDGRRKQVSNGGGNLPIWSRSGKELFYLNDDSLMSVVFDPATGAAAAPTRVFKSAILKSTDRFDVMPDGQHFVVAYRERDISPTTYTVVMNWFEELRKLSK